MNATGGERMHKDWLKEHDLPVGECEIMRKCSLYASRFIGDKTKGFACESAKGNLYTTNKNDEIIAVHECPYLSLAKVKIKH